MNYEFREIEFFMGSKKYIYFLIQREFLYLFLKDIGYKRIYKQNFK